MLKDNETIAGSDDGPKQESSPRTFDADQMVPCETCLRANPPTRVNCLYCGATLPESQSVVASPRPTLRPLEKWEQGYNNILLPSSANPNSTATADLAAFLKLETQELQAILNSPLPLPLALASSKAEAELIQQRLTSEKLASLIVADASLGLDAGTKLRSLEFHDETIAAYQSLKTPPIEIPWQDLILIVAGRITRKRVELIEERKRRENRVLEADQFFADEKVLDLYRRSDPVPFRIVSSSFDFSALADRKQLVAAENFAILIETIRERAPALVYDQTYDSSRKALEAVWRSEQQNESTGWRRARPGKLSIGSATETNNESQFLRYSRLRYFLLLQKPNIAAND